MNASSIELEVKGQAPDIPASEDRTSGDGIDLTLLQESLAKTVWERMLANDDALDLADLLHTSMLKTRAKPKSTDTPPR
jgi:hypothetical protein